MSESEVLERLDLKSRDGQFLWELQDGFELSPRESHLILETARLYYSQSPEPDSGRVGLWVLAKDAGVGKSLDELPKIQVWVTLDGGHEDIDAYQQYGHRGLRRQKLLRLSEEILEQGGIGTQEDLARVLGTSVRTIRRDIAYLRSQGIRVMTRGVYSDIGPSVSHKVMIVELFLSGFVYTEICRRLRHSAKSVKRYVTTFGRVVALYERGIKGSDEIARYVGISKRLVLEYLELYSNVKGKRGCAARIKEMLEQLSSRPIYPGADASGMKKGAVEEAGQ